MSSGGSALDSHKHVSYSPLSDIDIEDNQHHNHNSHARASHPPFSGETLRRNHSHADILGRGGVTMPGRAVYSRPKKTRIMRWLVLHANGDKQILTLDKRHLIQTFKLDVPIRDMRLLDSSFSNYETIGQISVRDNAILLSMEHVKAMIMADKVFLPLDEDKNDVKERFILYLEQLVQERAAEMGQEPRDPFGVGIPHAAQDPAVRSAFATHAHNATYTDNEVLPFELHVMEAALGEVCNHLAREVDLLQAQAQPALEELQNNADQPTLERVRRVKTSHQRLLGRAKLVREVLERLMEDDGDMLRMCLTRSVLRRAVTNLNNALSAGPGERGPSGRGPTPSPPSRDMAVLPSMNLDDTAHDATAMGNNNNTAPAGMASPSPSFSQPAGSAPCQQPVVGSLPQAFSTPFSNSFLSMNLRRHGNVMMAVPQADVLDAEEAHDLLDVENLLESYFMLVDSTHQSLVSIGEYIDDTEDLINIQLDYSRNKLIRFEIVLTTGTFAIAIFSAVAGMLGENLALPEVITTNFWGFALINLGVMLFCLAAYTIIVKILIQRKII